jgi:transcriptional adapter 2-beta
LLDAIEQYGFGNWCDISKHIETKSSTDTKKEFVERFIQGNIGVCTWDDKNNNEENNGFRRSMGLFPKPIDHTLPCDEGPLSPSLTQRLPPLDISSDEMLQLGYMPFRDDYEKVLSSQFMNGIDFFVWGL